MKKIIYGIITLLIIIFAVNMIIDNNKKNIDVSQGINILKDLESRDVTVVKNEIDQFRNETFVDENNDFSNLTYSQRFANSVIMGDSLAEGFSDYGIIDKSNVIANKGMVVSKAGEEISKAISKNPENIFISLGTNDIGYYNGNSEKFINYYRQLINQIKESLPNTKIYINCIMPVEEKAIENKPYLIHIDDFNAALKNLCNETDTTYIDNSMLIEGVENIYQSDGIHFKYEFYPLWIENMAKYAGI